MVLECRISQKTTTRMLGFVKTELLRKRATLVTARETTARMARVETTAAVLCPSHTGRDRLAESFITRLIPRKGNKIIPNIFGIINVTRNKSNLLPLHHVTKKSNEFVKDKTKKIIWQSQYKFTYD